MKITVRKSGQTWWLDLGHYHWPHKSWGEAMWRATGLAGL